MNPISTQSYEVEVPAPKTLRHRGGELGMNTALKLLTWYGIALALYFTFVAQGGADAIRAVWGFALGAWLAAVFPVAGVGFFSGWLIGKWMDIRQAPLSDRRAVTIVVAVELLLLALPTYWVTHLFWVVQTYPYSSYVYLFFPLWYIPALLVVLATGWGTYRLNRIRRAIAAEKGRVLPFR